MNPTINSILSVSSCTSTLRGIARRAAATLATKVLQSMLFQTSTTDAVTFALVPVVLLVVATVASLIPALRATRTDPLVVIRAE